MKYLISLLSLVLFSTAQASLFGIQQQYQALQPETRQQYDRIAQKVKPQLEPLEAKVLSLARSQTPGPQQRLSLLNETQTQLLTWIDGSLLRYSVLLPLLYTIEAAQETIAAELPFIIPYQDSQIRAQFNISGAQPYEYGGVVSLVRGTLQRGTFTTGDKVIVYFKQGGPVVTSLKEEVSASSTDQAWLLADLIEPARFIGGAVMFIPQS